MKTIMQQYTAAKRLYPDAILLFRMGDFYEVFGADAEACAKTLGLSITRGGDVTKAGFPYHHLEVYLRKLLHHNHRVAVCERLEQVPELAKPDRVCLPTGAARFTLTDLIDKKNLLAWLNADGKPPTVRVGQKIKPVSDEATLDQWWGEYRAALASDFLKSAANKHKPQTHTQFIQECLKACGIKSGGTVQERVQRAILMRPDLYTGAAQVKDLEAARLEALKVKMNLTTNLEGRAA